MCVCITYVNIEVNSDHSRKPGHGVFRKRQIFKVTNSKDIPKSYPLKVGIKEIYLLEMGKRSRDGRRGELEEGKGNKKN